MKVAFYLNCVSAHQLPLAKEVAELVGPENFRYVDAGERSESAQSAETQGLKFKVQGLRSQDDRAGVREWLETADVMLTVMRDWELFERRAGKGLRTFYASERWWKPVRIVRLFGLFDCSIGGWVRMLVPSYRRMAKRFVKWANEDDGARVLATGPWAKKDFLRMGVRAEKIVEWGYFVEKGRGKREEGRGKTILKLLWCGRMLDWKRVETIIRAANECKAKSLGLKVTLVGDGPEKANLIRLAQRFFGDGVAIEQSNNLNNPNNQTIAFLPGQPMEKVREQMREHDLYVLSSNGSEGWGAVVSEALEEGMRVLGTFEAGASAALLPRERLFHSGDWRGLAQLIEKDLCGELPSCSIGEWTAKAAAKRLMGL